MLRSNRSVAWVFLSAGLVGLVGCATPQQPPTPDLGALVGPGETSRADAHQFAPALHAESMTVRRRAVLALARLERLDAVDPILAMLTDVDPDVRAMAAFAAGQLDLAFDPARADHEARRIDVEKSLIQRLQTESVLPVRLALLRALGAVAARQGLAVLVEKAAQGSSGERAAAFLALGVSGSRRKASLSRDDATRHVIETGLGDGDPEVVEAAAFAAFRQRVALGETALVAARSSPSSQARIFVARTLPVVDAALALDTATVLLRDPDWRVRVEVLPVVTTRHDVVFDPSLWESVMGEALSHATKGGELHVVRTACSVLSDVGAPLEAVPLLQTTLRALPQDADEVRCTCAGALDVLGGGDDALQACTSSPTKRRRHHIESITHRRVSLIEKVAALKPFLDDEQVSVRIAAATAVCAQPTPAAAEVAVARLQVEEDPGVAGALLACALHDEPPALSDAAFATLATRFASSTLPEAIDVLLALAPQVRKRPHLPDWAKWFENHAEPRVRDAARGIAPGDRASGPRALASPPPSPATLPLAAVLRTSRGDITLEFLREVAPVATQTFVSLALAGTYRGTPFHRVIADFVAQGGDPRGDGTGGPGFLIPCENSDEPFVRGSVGIATAGKDTGGSQFFLVHSRQPHLDGRYTLFARVTQGLEVMDALQRDDVLADVEVVTALRPTAR